MIANDYIDINNLVVEVHNLHVKNRPDVYLAVDNPLLKEQFGNLLNSNNTTVCEFNENAIKFYEAVGMSTRMPLAY